MTYIAQPSKVGPKGQAVIPKALRDRLGIRPGDSVQFRLHGDHLHVEPVAKDLAAYFASLTTTGAGAGLRPGEVDELLDDQFA